jgi:anti-sigma regulatory factor (Ser/Thr protein kinase)
MLHGAPSALPDSNVPIARRITRKEMEPSSQIVIQAKLEQLPTLEHWVERLAAEFALPAALVHRIDLCLTELVTNVVSYGYPDGGTGSVSIRFWRHPEQIIIQVDDDGIAFDPTSHESAGLPSTLADAPAGGRGIRLVRHFSDQLHYLAAVTGNQLTLLFRCAGTGASPSATAAAGARGGSSNADR